ncbi:hypothetical protein RFI_22347 [Reticulomyxa filosa]|uniref:Uncharacterized protein n=1 Tax=Reticulomyxa filosa TaxID=46433 RepID=X6MNL7_RETFI|nr:hypothetical protein RFI_22347 [Reticulomyxa filosa]|eukprot:ETO15022.1 hypothetical protein RFI_22347 [Reticulomyxa filosa]
MKALKAVQNILCIYFICIVYYIQKTLKSDSAKAKVIVRAKKKVYVIASCRVNGVKKTKLTLKAMSYTRKATLLKLVDHTPTGGDNKVTTFDMAKLCKGDDKYGALQDPEILQYMQDLMGSKDKRFSRSTSSAAGHAWHYDDLSHEDHNHLPIHFESLENTHCLHVDLTSKDNKGKTLVLYLCFYFYVCLLNTAVLICKYNLKYDKFGSGGYYTFWLFKDHKHIVWFSQKKEEANTKIPINSIVEIRIGENLMWSDE